MAGFIQLLRTEPADELLRFPNAFALLTLIALRARREVPQINPHGLQIGEAMIGDHAAVGLSRQEFRSALSNLQKWSLVTIRATNKGTIAKLSGTSIYDINAAACNQPANQPATSQQPANNQPATTNNNVRKEEGEKEKKEQQASSAGGADLASPVEDTQPESPTPAQRPTARTPKLFRYDNAPVFLITEFFACLTANGYGHVDKAMYLMRIQEGARRGAYDTRKLKEEATNDEWKAFILRWLDGDKANKRLLLPDEAPRPGYSGPNPALQVTTTSTSYSREAIAARNVTKY